MYVRIKIILNSFSGTFSILKNGNINTYDNKKVKTQKEEYNAVLTLLKCIGLLQNKSTTLILQKVAKETNGKFENLLFV